VSSPESTSVAGGGEAAWLGGGAGLFGGATSSARTQLCTGIAACASEAIDAAMRAPLCCFLVAFTACWEKFPAGPGEATENHYLSQKRSTPTGTVTQTVAGTKHRSGRMLFSTSKTFKTLRTICLRDLKPQSSPTADGVVLPLTISAEGCRMHAFQTEGVDCNQETVKLSFYNLPSPGTAGVGVFTTFTGGESLEEMLQERTHLSRTILKVGTKILIKDPWLKHQLDGTVGIRVENPDNVAFAHQELCHTCGVSETTERKKLLRCGKCGGLLLLDCLSAF
jgi:hypothetical protein